MSDPNPLTGRIEIRVRYAEVDQMGVLHHSRYWVYFEMGRTELLRSQGLNYRDIEAAGCLLVIVRCSAKFHAPARYDDELVLETTLTNLGRAKIEHSYQLRRKSDGALLATAETTLAAVDRDGRVIEVPAVIRKTGAGPISAV